MMDSDSESLPHPRFRLARHHVRAEVDAFAGYLNDSFANESDEQDDQPTPKVSNNVALAAETPASRLRALLSRVPNNKPPQSTVVPPHSRLDLVDSDVDAPDESQPSPSANHTYATSSSLSLARESLRGIFTRARREPGDTPQKDSKPRARRSSFDELDSVPRKSRRSGKRKSLSDEELEKLPSDLPTTSTQDSRTMSINDLRERLLMESQTQLQDQHPPSLYEHSDPMTQDSNATPLFTTSTPQQFPRKTPTSQIHSSLPSQLGQTSQSNLLDADSEMQRAIENVESDDEHGPGFGQVSFPGATTAEATELPGSASASTTPGRSRIPLTRSRLNSLDKTYVGTTTRRASGEHHRSASRTSSIASTQSSMSFSDEAERIRERERDWNKPKPPVRPSTPELKQGHLHGRFSSRLDSPIVGSSSARRTRTVSMTSLEDLSSSSVGSRVEYREQMEEMEREKLHEREREWNKRRPRLSHPSPNSLLNHQERSRTASFTHASRPDSAMSISSTASLQRPQSFSPSSGAELGRRESPNNPPEGYLHERERNWNSPRPRWLQNPVTSVNGRKRADSLRSTGSSSQEVEHDDQPLSAPLPQSRPQSHHSGMQQPQSRPQSRASHRSSPLDHSPHFPSPSSHSRTGARSTPSPGPGSRPNSRNSISRPTQIPVRVPAKSAQLPLKESNSPPTVHHRQRGNLGNHLRVDRDEDCVSLDRTPTIRTVQPPPLETLKGPRSSSPQHNLEPSARERQVTTLSGSVMSAPFKSSKHRESPSRSRLNGPTSFLQTPPRSSFSSNSGTLDFQSPSPPRGLPELPGPPPISDEEESPDLNYSSIGWETAVTQENVDEKGNLTTTKTPRPPGAWMMTPAQFERGADPPAHAQQVSAVNETEYDGGLVTPVPSLSRGTALQTPVPPGAWVPTPATVRKSVLRVRFEPSASETTQSDVTATEENSGVTEKAPDISVQSFPNTNNTGPMEALLEVRSRTPELPPPIAKPKSPKSPRKSHKIRVLDAFGRETPEPVNQENEQVNALNSSPSRSKGSIRIVDAMGREIASDAKNGIGNTQLPEHSLPSPPLDSREALVRVRRGLSDLAQEIDEINRATSSTVQDSRIQELERLSRQSRSKREELATRLYTTETDLKSKVQAIRKGASIVQSTHRSSWIPNGQRILWLAAHVILTIFLYRFITTQARDMFLSTYYDPFYPDLHMYTIRPDITHHRMGPSETTWISLLDTLQHHGWKNTLTVLCDNFSIFLYDLRTRIWETWGEDTTRQVSSWPPT